MRISDQFHRFDHEIRVGFLLRFQILLDLLVPNNNIMHRVVALGNHKHINLTKVCFTRVCFHILRNLLKSAWNFGLPFSSTQYKIIII